MKPIYAFAVAAAIVSLILSFCFLFQMKELTEKQILMTEYMERVESRYVKDVRSINTMFIDVFTLLLYQRIKDNESK